MPDYEEFLENDPVYQAITYVEYVSKSKGRRNGKQRLRRCWKEVRLISYLGNGFTQEHRFPFDEYAPEILDRSAKPDEATETLRELIPLRARRG